MKLWLNQQGRTSLVSSPLSPACRAHQQELPAPGSLRGPGGGPAGQGQVQAELRWEWLGPVWASLPVDPNSV